MGIDSWVKDNVDGALGGLTDKAADALQDHLKIGSSTLKQGAPILAAAAVGLTALANEPEIEKLGKRATRLVHDVVTGWGQLEKIPVAGKAFTGAGWVVDQVGEFSSWILTGAASLLTYKLFQSKPGQPVGETSRMPNSGTGAVGQEPVRADFSVYQPGTRRFIGAQNGPTKPMPVTASADAATLAATRPDVAAMDYTALRGERVKALEEATSNPVLSAQLRALMQDENQRYENRRLFLKRVTEFTGSAATSPRNSLITMLSNNGLSSMEAVALVPDAPRLRYTVTQGKTATESTLAHGKLNDFDGKFKQLADFAQKAEEFYGAGYFSVSERSADGKVSTVRIAFDAMSVSQQQEFIEKALEHCRTQYKHYETDCAKVINTSIPSSGPMLGHISSERQLNYRRDPKSQGFFDSWESKPAEEGSSTFHDASGAPRVRTWREEHSFLTKLNGDSEDYIMHKPDGTKVYDPPYKGLGGSIDFKHYHNGGGIVGSSVTFQGWQGLLDQHREDLKLAESGYSGEIKRYADRVRFMQQSLERMRSDSVGLLDYSDSHIQIRDLRQFAAGSADDKSKVSRLEGEWADATHAQFTVRAVTGVDGKKQLLKAPLAINISTGEGMKDLMARIDEARTPALMPNIAPLGVTSMDRTPGASRVTVVDNRTPGQSASQTFAGVFEGDKFTASGVVVPGKTKPLPPLPEQEKLKLRENRDYEQVGKTSGYYIWGGDIYRDVKLRNPEGKEQIYVLHSSRHNNDWLVTDVALKEEGHDRENLAWYNAEPGDFSRPETRVKLTGAFYESGMEPHNYVNLAKTAALIMDNPAINAANAAKEKRFHAALKPTDLQVIAPLPQPQMIVKNVNSPNDWLQAVNGARFSVGTVSEKGAGHADDPLKGSKHMVEIVDSHLRYDGRVIVHGNYDAAKKHFAVEGYELRAKGLADDKPGQYVQTVPAMELDFASRDFHAFFAKVAQGISAKPGDKTTALKAQASGLFNAAPVSVVDGSAVNPAIVGLPPGATRLTSV